MMRRRGMRWMVTLSVVLGVGGMAACGSASGSENVELAREGTTSSSGNNGDTSSADSVAPAVDAVSSPASSETRTVTETKPLAFATKSVKSSSLAKGLTKVKVKGQAGVVRITYRVTLVGGVEKSRTLVGRQVIKKPVTGVLLVGTKASKSSKCDPNYSGACVPIASDVDCASGSGNGPAYVSGPVRVIGTDIYDLDRDGDGIGCE